MFLTSPPSSVPHAAATSAITTISTQPDNLEFLTVDLLLICLITTLFSFVGDQPSTTTVPCIPSS